MLRALSSSVLSALLLVTLMWGGCISCPQFYMLPKAEKSCCNKAGKCKRQNEKAPEKECQRMPLELPSIDGSHAVVVDFVSMLMPEVLSIPPVAVAVHRELLPPEYSPPDVHALHATFLI